MYKNTKLDYFATWNIIKKKIRFIIRFGVIPDGFPAKPLNISGGYVH